jgi:hypothetical protein
MTNHRKRFPIAYAILGIAVAALGCSAPGAGGGSDNAVLVLGFNPSPQSTSRLKSMAIVPAGLAVSSIEVELRGPGGATVQATSDGSAPVELELAPGSWSVAAKGFNADRIQFLEGSLALRLEPSERASRTLVLRPIAGSGSISLTWSLSGELGGTLAVSGSLEGPGGERRAVESPFARPEGSPLIISGLSSGAWKLSLSLLRDGVAACGLADGVLVAANMTTMASVIFSPPGASMALSFLVPDYGSTSLGLEPAVRRAAAGGRVAFKADREGPLSWYAEGSALAESGPTLRLDVPSAASSLRVDCVRASADGLSPPLSGSARLFKRDAQGLGRIAWTELLRRSEQDAAAQALARGLSDCKDLAWSPSGNLLAAAGRNSDGVSLFDAAEAGALFPLASAGGPSEPLLAAPSRLRFASESLILAISESQGAAYALAIEGPAAEPTLRLVGAFADPLLAGAKDLALAKDMAAEDTAAPAGSGGRIAAAYIAAQLSDSVVLLSLGADGAPTSARTVAAAGTGELAAFSRPACVALNDAGNLLAVGTAGDDAIYLFDRDLSSGDLAPRQRIDRSAFPSGAPLSDPCALAFAPGSTSLYALSYYGRALIRLDRDLGTGAFMPVAGARSGTGEVRGFATPRGLGLDPNAGLAAVAGGGADDGLAAFDLASAGGLAYIGSILPPQGDAVPLRSTALSFSPDGRRLALASDGSLSIFTVSIGN